jgi:WhiB family redox-sensing transcriptional regulator
MSEALASQPIDQLAEPNAVLAWLQIPSDHSELPDVLPERTGVFLRELYEVQPDDPITTEELLGRVAVDIDEINGAVARLNVRFVVAGFNRTTLRLVAPNANRSVNTLRQIVSRRLAAAANVVDPGVTLAPRAAQSNSATFVPAKDTTGPGSSYPDQAPAQPVTLAKREHPYQAKPPSNARATTQVATVAPRGSRTRSRPASESAIRAVFTIAGGGEGEWRERALCAQTDPEAFYPEQGGSTREAKKVCLGCEVKDKCLAYALENDERYGIWGGLSRRQRVKQKEQAS